MAAVWSHRLRVLEAAWWLVVVGVALVVRPFHRLVGPRRTPTDTLVVTTPEVMAARRIGVAVTSAARWLPWHPVCLPRALAARAMLGRRGIPCTLHMGAKAVRTPGETLQAHAWLTVGEAGITGMAEAPAFTEIGRFS
jgi:hypothetical protein